jgi:hypothetical protein
MKRTSEKAKTPSLISTLAATRQMKTRAWTRHPAEFEEFCDRASKPRAILKIELACQSECRHAHSTYFHAQGVNDLQLKGTPCAAFSRNLQAC